MSTKSIHSPEQVALREAAASWLVDEAPSSDAIPGRVDDGGDIWGIGRRDQEELWRFVAQMVPDPVTLQTLWRFAASQPAEQALLQKALQEWAQSLGATLRIDSMTLEPP